MATKPGRWRTRDGLWGAPLWVRAGLVTVAIGLFTFRFADRDLVPYILDEPQLQDAAQADALSGRWAQISVLHGTQGMRYGPAALWFYAAVHRLVGPLPERSILATTLLLTAAQLALALAVARALGGGSILFSTLAALLASSPYLFFWSRSGWDNPLLGAWAAGAVALLLTRGLPAAVRGGLLGVLVGLGLSTHLMAIPFSLAVVAVLCLQGRNWRLVVSVLGPLVLVALTVSLPYLLALQTEPSLPAPAWHRWGGAVSAAGRICLEFIETGRIQTAAGMERFLDQAATLFREGLGAWTWVLDAGPALSWVLALLAAAGLVASARSANPQARVLGRLGLLVWTAHAVFLGLPSLQLEPHYQQPTAWIVPTGCCALALPLLSRRRWAACVLVGGLWAVALAEVGLAERWMLWLRAHGGTAGIHYSVPLSAQRSLLQEACTTDRQMIALANRTYLFPQSLLSLAQTESACAGKRVAVCPLNCPALDGRWRVVSVRYAAPPGGRLARLVSP
jgi:hypothetical protein